MRKPHEWWDRTWNPITGCTRVSAGCANCYAHVMHGRFGTVTHHEWHTFGELEFHTDRLKQPQGWRKPQVVFVGSMTDMFHEQVRDDWFLETINVMQDVPQHTYVILTKRPERIDHMVRLLGDGFFPPSNWYIGVSVEDQQSANVRIPALIDGWPGPKIVSYEPALGPINLGPWLDILDGVLAGAETGPKARAAVCDWFRRMCYQCAYPPRPTPFFLKQVNARRERGLDGRTHDDLPWCAP